MEADCKAPYGQVTTYPLGGPSKLNLNFIRARVHHRPAKCLADLGRCQDAIVYADIVHQTSVVPPIPAVIQVVLTQSAVCPEGQNHGALFGALESAAPSTYNVTLPTYGLIISHRAVVPLVV